MARSGDRATTVWGWHGRETVPQRGAPLALFAGKGPGETGPGMGVLRRTEGDAGCWAARGTAPRERLPVRPPRRGYNAVRPVTSVRPSRGKRVTDERTGLRTREAKDKSGGKYTKGCQDER